MISAGSVQENVSEIEGLDLLREYCCPLCRIESVDAVVTQVTNRVVVGVFLWGMDYFHLARYEVKWKIVHVLWQSLDE